MNQNLLSSLSEEGVIAFYGALFAIAAVDQGVDVEEWTLIFEQLNTEELSEAAQTKMQSFLLMPPDLEKCLQDLTAATEPQRLGVMINLVDMAWADDILADNEKDALERAAAILHVDSIQLAAMVDFVKELRHIRHQGTGNAAAQQAVSIATERLYAANVSQDALRFSSAFLYEPSVAAVTGAHTALKRP